MWCAVVCCAGAFKYLTVGLDKLDTWEIEGELGNGVANVKMIMAEASGAINRSQNGKDPDRMVLVARELDVSAKKYEDVQEDGKGK